ncbi:hypothetical protein JX265_004275 [Neoarthrinium moseri]|uniref:GH16 domain-containing protein n=1 Tax=Neoarthrinium moseri TaxID=1658444 RepID=A0A9Q0ASR5_9PEZI|nr:hypothetical protein JX265_004275 [Neoarthrinium moseri]
MAPSLAKSVGIVAAAYATSTSALKSYHQAESKLGTGDINDVDPTGGYVQYQNSVKAQELGLVSIENDQVYIGPETKQTYNPFGYGRKSVRLESVQTYNHGLFIADFAHLPKPTCGAWPSFWMFGEPWPTKGEIDIMENWNDLDFNRFTAHVASPDQIGTCTVRSADMLASTAIDSVNCYDHAPGQWDFQGCSASDHGAPFGSAEGGVYALEWTSSALNVWSWPHLLAPLDIALGKPLPSTWGLPRFSIQNCDIEKAFSDMRFVLNIDFCAVAGQDAQWGASCKASTGYDTCTKYVAENGDHFSSSYFKLSSIKIFNQQEEDVTSSTSSSVASSTSSSLATSSSTISTTTEVTSTTSSTTTSTLISSSTTSDISSSATVSSTKGPETVSSATVDTSSSSVSESVSSSYSASSTDSASIPSITESATISSSGSAQPTVSSTASSSISDDDDNCTDDESSTSYEVSSTYGVSTTISASSILSSSGYPVYPTGPSVTYPGTASATGSSSQGASESTTSPVEYTTSTVYTTRVHTVTSCAPTVTNCPANGEVVVTEVIPLYTTVCPVGSTQPTTVPEAPANGYSTSTQYITSIYTITACAATVTNCPVGSVTTDIKTAFTSYPVAGSPSAKGSGSGSPASDESTTTTTSTLRLPTTVYVKASSSSVASSPSAPASSSESVVYVTQTATVVPVITGSGSKYNATLSTSASPKGTGTSSVPGKGAGGGSVVVSGAIKSSGAVSMILLGLGGAALLTL